MMIMVAYSSAQHETANEEEKIESNVFDTLKRELITLPNIFWQGYYTFSLNGNEVCWKDNLLVSNREFPCN
jgi:hypothetical protein